MLWIIELGLENATDQNSHGKGARREISRDLKERGAGELPRLILHYTACCLLWSKEWFLPQHRRFLSPKGLESRFGMHGSLWHGKIKRNAGFKNHDIRYALWKTWLKIKPDFVQKYYYGFCHRKQVR